MKKIFVVFNTAKNGKYHAIAETIKTGENLLPFIKRYEANVVHLCETRKQADTLAIEWNQTYKENGTNLY